MATKTTRTRARRRGAPRQRCGGCNRILTAKRLDGGGLCETCAAKQDGGGAPLTTPNAPVPCPTCGGSEFYLQTGAALELDVTRQRVIELHREGRIEGLCGRDGKGHLRLALIPASAVAQYKNSPRKPGRPHKNAPPRAPAGRKGRRKGDTIGQG